MDICTTEDLKNLSRKDKPFLRSELLKHRWETEADKYPRKTGKPIFKIALIIQIISRTCGLKMKTVL